MPLHNGKSIVGRPSVGGLCMHDTRCWNVPVHNVHMDDEGGGRYSYEWRQGVLPISWEDYFAICKGLAKAVAPFQPDLILGIIRGGMYAATLLSHLLRAELYAIRVTSRLKDIVVHEQPVWMVRPPELVRDATVLIVDEI